MAPELREALPRAVAVADNLRHAATGRLAADQQFLRDQACLARTVAVVLAALVEHPELLGPA